MITTNHQPILSTDTTNPHPSPHHQPLHLFLEPLQPTPPLILELQGLADHIWKGVLVVDVDHVTWVSVVVGPL